MTYADFTLEGVEQAFGVRSRLGDLWPDAAPVAPPAWLPEQLRRGQRLALLSEKARSEFIVAPILLAARELCGDAFAIYSGQRLDVDAAVGLAGECDFLLTLTEPLPRVAAPLMAVVEAKKNDVEAGLGQCVAQMLAARRFNQQAGSNLPATYGCVTTGELWRFLRLDEEGLLLDRRRWYVEHLDRILGLFVAAVAEARGTAV